MKKILLLEGAIAGHMNHVYDNGEMSFAELKQLVVAAADGKLRGTEKTDGQNIYISFNVKTNRAVQYQQTPIQAVPHIPFHFYAEIDE